MTPPPLPRTTVSPASSLPPFSNGTRAFKGMSTSGHGDLSQFGDAGAVSGWAQEGVSWAVGAGLISGKGDGVLDPQGGATRAEAAVILQRFLEK